MSPLSLPADHQQGPFDPDQAPNVKNHDCLNRCHASNVDDCIVHWVGVDKGLTAKESQGTAVPFEHDLSADLIR